MDDRSLLRLHDAIAAVCPIDGLNPDAGRIDYAEGSTQQQRDAAVAVMAAFDADASTAEDVDTERDRRLATYTFGGKVYQFDSESRENINGVGTLALAAIINGSQPGDYRWADADVDFSFIALDNTPVLMDAQTAWNFAQSAAIWKKQHIYAARAIKDTSPIPANYADDSLWPTA